MIPIQIALTILLVLLAAAYVFELLAHRQERKVDRLEQELDEMEARRHTYPIGNVVVLTPPAPEAEDMSPDKETEGSS